MHTCAHKLVHRCAHIYTNKNKYQQIYNVMYTNNQKCAGCASNLNQVLTLEFCDFQKKKSLPIGSFITESLQNIQFISLT